MMDFAYEVLSHPSPLYSNPDNAFRIAVVGCGPRGMYCLDQLSEALSGASEVPRVEIVIYEPARHLGAGNVYDPDQPRCLRMNFAARFIDAWRSDDAHRPPRKRTLVDWLDIHYPEYAAGNAYVPRAIVGEYLCECFETVTDQLAKVASVQIHPSHVQSVERQNDRWRILTGTGTHDSFDEVMLTVGHEGWRDSKRDHQKIPTIPHVFPVERQLNPDVVPTGSTVSIRGFGLTAIDAILALTEGRGGQFIKQGDRWKYQASGSEPRCILPYSRTGRPMLAKPIDGVTRVPRGIDAVWQRARNEVATFAGRSDIDFSNEIWPIFLRAAAQGLGHCNPHGLRWWPGKLQMSRGQAAWNCENWFERWCDREFDGDSVLEALNETYDVAFGRRLPGPAWAIAEAWRRIYPALVDLVRTSEWTEEGWKGFWPIASEMERVAFGPPAENIGRMLALVDFGLLDLSSTRGTSGISLADVCVNAVLPSPGEFAPRGPVSQLLRQGTLRQREFARGIAVNDAGRIISSNDGTLPGLALLGRATEGCILGNDTLSRKLHDTPRRWAKSVVALSISRQRTHD